MFFQCYSIIEFMYMNYELIICCKGSKKKDICTTYIS